VLNAINKTGMDGRIKYFIREPNKRERPKERIGSPHEKIFILVSVPALQSLATLGRRGFRCQLRMTWAGVIYLCNHRSHSCFPSLQINDALSDMPSEDLEYSMKQELANILRSGSRLAACMSQ
jgi:hypothetical protein